MEKLIKSTEAKHYVYECEKDSSRTVKMEKWRGRMSLNTWGRLFETPG